MSISAKLYIIIGVFFVVFSAFVGYILITGWTDSLRDMTANRQIEDARQVIDKIDRVLYERVIDVKNLALSNMMRQVLENKTNPGLDSHSITAYVLALANSTGPWEVLRYVNKDRITVASDRLEDVGFQLNDERELYVFNKAMEGEVVSDDAHRHDTGEYHILFAAPVTDNTIQGKPVVGVVIGYFPFQVLQEILDSIETSGVSLINKHGIEIGSNHEDRINPTNYSDYSGTKQFALSQKQRSGVAVLPNLETGEPSLTTFEHESGYLDYHGNNWSIFLQTPMSEINAAITKIIIPTAAIYLLIVAVSIFMIVELFQITLIRPLGKLVIAVKSISSGNLASRVDIRSSDEIGQLARAFNDMSQSLSGLYTGLEEKVKERTLELEIQSAESERKYKEYEDMNKLMIGRELKMSELKKEIEALRQARGKS